MSSPLSDLNVVVRDDLKLALVELDGSDRTTSKFEPNQRSFRLGVGARRSLKRRNAIEGM